MAIFYYRSLQSYFHVRGDHSVHEQAIFYEYRTRSSYIIALVCTPLAISAAILAYPRYYTFIIFLFLAAALLLFALSTNLMQQKAFITTIVMSYIPFFAVNYALTSAPIVWYSPSAIMGWRISTIPVEDFIYSLVMVALWLYLYTFSKQRRIA